jgi:hypothetical protein
MEPSHGTVPWRNASLICIIFDEMELFPGRNPLTDRDLKIFGETREGYTRDEQMLHKHQSMGSEEVDLEDIKAILGLRVWYLGLPA